MDDYVHVVRSNSERTWMFLRAFVVRYFIACRKMNVFEDHVQLRHSKNELSWKTSNSYIQEYPEFGCSFPFITLSYFRLYGYQNGSAILILNALLPQVLLPLPIHLYALSKMEGT